MNETPIIAAFIEEGLLDAEMFAEGGTLAGATGIPRRARAEAYVLTESGLDETELLAKLANAYTLERAQVDAFAHIERDALELLPTGLIREYRVIPAHVSEDRVQVYVVEPLDDEAKAELEEEMGRSVQELIWPAIRFYEALSRLFGDSPAPWLSAFLEGSAQNVGLHEESLAESKPQVDWGRGWSAATVSQFLRNTYDRDVVLQVVLGFALEWFESSAILVVGNGTVQAVFVREWALFESVDLEELRRTRGSVNSDAMAIGGRPARGTPDELGLVALFDAFGEVPDESLATIPIPIGSRTAMVLLGRLRNEADYESTQLEATAVEVGEQLETIIKMVKSKGLPPEGERIPDLPEEVVEVERDGASAEENSKPSESEDASEESDPLESDVETAFESVASEIGVEPLDEEDLEIVEEPPEFDPQAKAGKEEFGEGEVDEQESGEDGADEEEDDRTQVARGMPFGGEPDVAHMPSGTVEFRRPSFDSDKAGRSTQNLELDDSGPRMPGVASSAVEDEESESIPPMPGIASSAALEEDSDDGGPRTEMAPPGATMFGLPLAEKNEEEEKVDEEEANRTMFGLPLTAKREEPAVADEASEELEVSSSAEDEAASDSESSEEPVDPPSQAEDEEDSEVRVVTPQDVSEGKQGRTLMGGMEAAADIVGDMKISGRDRAPRALVAEASEDQRQKEVPTGTLRGGIEAVRLEETSRDELEGDESESESIGEESAPEDKAARSGLIPGMMILKGAGKSASVAPKKKARKRKPTPNPATTLPDYGEALKSDAEEDSRPESVADAESKPKAAGSTPPGGIAEDTGHSTQMGMQDDWASESASEEYQKKNEEVHDAWFDYFAPESSDASSSSEEEPEQESDKLPDFFADDESDAEEAHPSIESEPSEPRTIPPEMLERLLESGPKALDLQEHILELEDRDPSVAFAAADKVAESGTIALEALSEIFPGRIFVDRYQHTAESMPPVEEHGPVLAALVRIGGDEAALVASKHIRSTSNEKRFYATYLFTEIPAELVLTDLTARAFDKDRQIRNVAGKVLRGYTRSPHFRVRVLQPLRNAMEGDDELRLEAAANMLADFRDVRSIPVLINALGQHADHTNRAIYTALQLITLKEWSSPYEWKNWWESAANESRPTWILQAMESPSENLRQLAFDEIQRIPGLDSSYHYDQPKKLRQRARDELELWFETNEFS